MKIGIVGAGAMGSGISQVAAMAGHEVRLYDQMSTAATKALAQIESSLQKMVAKDKISPSQAVAIVGSIYLCDKLSTLFDCDLIIEAIIEDLDIKKSLFKELESFVSPQCILATNTSSISISSIASSLQQPERFIGIHFFNPPILMQLVELIPALQTDTSLTEKISKLIVSWGKTVVVAKDSPGFIVNKVARPYYSEAIRIWEEGMADIYTIDAAMTSNGFRMGPFTLMDFIGHDVNYRVTESVWKSFYYDRRYTPSIGQLRLLEAGYLGKKSGRGFYNYADEALKPQLEENKFDDIFIRIISMLVNEAFDTIDRQICTKEDLEMAVVLGLNYPKGLLQWAAEIGFGNIVKQLESLYQMYGEERYRISPYLRRLANG